MSQWIKPGERGSFLVPVVIAVVLAGFLVLGYFVVMSMPGPGKETAKEGGAADASFDVRWATVAEVKEKLSLNFTTWKGVLSCRSLSNRDPFEREVDILLSEDGVFYERLAAPEFAEMAEGKPRVPQEFPNTFEWWRGTVSGRQVDVEGWYREGTDKVKPLSLSGQAYEGYMFLEGRRGPRDCTYEAVREGSGQSLNEEWGT